MMKKPEPTLQNSECKGKMKLPLLMLLTIAVRVKEKNLKVEVFQILSTYDKRF